MIDIIAILGLFSIPISAIIGNYYYKIKKLQVGQGLSASERQKILQLEEENKALRQRLENVEIIVASADLELLTSRASAEDIKRLKDSINQVQAQSRFKIH